MLSILSFFLDGEPIMECPEYPILVVDHDDNRRWFRAGDLIVGLRLMALPTLQKIWESPLLVYSNSGLMQTFIACLGPIISAQHEARTTGALPGIRRHLPNLLEGHTPHSMRRRTEQRLTSPLLSNAFEAFDRAIGPSQTSGQSTTEVEPISLYVTELVNMGFSNEEANTVLRRYSNNLERATEYLLNTRLAERSRRALGAEGSVSADAQPAPSTDDGNAQAAATADDSNAQAAEASVEQTQDTEPMSVDSTGQGEEGSREDTNAASDNNNADSSPKPSGILGVEPFTLPEWRKAREAEEDERREQLQKLRETLCASIAPRVIALMNEFKDKAVSQARGVLELVLRKNEAEPTVRVLLDSFMPLLDSVT
ncbi:E3 ubiquitin-protein ligase tom1, partial [Coemansia sp. RSA 551]